MRLYIIPDTVAEAEVTGNFESNLQLWDRAGRRKYVTLAERSRFIRQSEKAEEATKLFCLVLAITGARISEALALTPQQIDAGKCCVTLRTLKRRALVFREVPVPLWLMKKLVGFTWTMVRDEPIWPWCRQTAWHRVKNMMDAARITGGHATPKGLRHGFGLLAVEENVPLPVIARWMGHSSTETTMIYLNALGQEERRFAQRMWRHDYARV